MSVQRDVYEVKWRIENIIPWLQTKNLSLCSPQFTVDTRWKLILFWKWNLKEKYLSLALQMDAEDEISKPINVNYELSFLASDETVLKSKSFSTKFALNIVGQELKVKGTDILVERKETYLPESVLTVCCKLWKPCSEVSKNGKCSIRSVIGKKCITLDSAINNFNNLRTYSNVTVNFMSPFSEISFISFTVLKKEDFNGRNQYLVSFTRKEIECNRFHYYSCELFVLRNDGGKRECAFSRNLAKLLSPEEVCTFDINCYYGTLNCSEFLKNNTLALQFQITYYPGVESEYVEYDTINYQKLTSKSADLENVSIYNSEDVHSSQLDCIQQSENENEPCDAIENETSGDKCFDTAENKQLLITTLKNDLTSLYNEKLFCDIKLQTDTETFPAHRNVLSARSPVFKKMLTTDMKEKAGGCINIPDISSDTVGRMLQFLYTDCTGDLDMQSAKDLYIASDKYDIVSLKQRCSIFIKKNLCPANVCEIIVLADMHHDKDLETAVRQFVLTYDEEVFGSDQWKLFMKNYASLAAEVMYLKCMKK